MPKQVRARLEETKQLFPEGIDYSIAMDTTDFTRASIADVVKTSFKAVVLVIIVVFQKVSDALPRVQKSRERRVAQGRDVDALSAYARLARQRYESGCTRYMEVLDAEPSLFSAQLAYTQTRSNAYTSLVTLYKAMGGGWGVETPARLELNTR